MAVAYQSKLESESTNMLFDAILALENREDCYRFFEDLCTVSELLAVSQRFEVAYLLAKGTTYHEIAAQTGASTATISRINRCLNYGADGYRNALKKMQ